jgi:hypothetical protein
MDKIIKIIFTIALTVVLFTGCMTKPLTKNVINELGIEDINRFQFYTSADVALTATEKVREQNINKQGTAKIRETSYREIIIISKNTMGVLMDSKIDENGLLILEICFEDKPEDSDKRLIFKQEGPGLENNFFIVYRDPRKRLLSYGDREYFLESRTGERIFLQIKIDSSQKEKERIRRAKGRKVEN